jgi:hypothetical protein
MKKIVPVVFMFTFILGVFAFAANDAIEESCGVGGTCHSTDTVYNSPKRTPARWDSTVTRMERHGLKLSGSQKAAVREYLYTLVP